MIRIGLVVPEVVWTTPRSCAYKLTLGARLRVFVPASGVTGLGALSAEEVEGAEEGASLQVCCASYTSPPKGDMRITGLSIDVRSCGRATPRLANVGGATSGGGGGDCMSGNASASSPGMLSGNGPRLKLPFMLFDAVRQKNLNSDAP